MNLVLLLTALLTCLTGMISGDRAIGGRVQATALAAERGVDRTARTVVAPAVAGRTVRPIAPRHMLRRAKLALPSPLILTSAWRLTPEKRRE